MNYWYVLAGWGIFIMVVYLFMAIEVAWYNARVRRFFSHLQQIFLEDED